MLATARRGWATCEVLICARQGVKDSEIACGFTSAPLLNQVHNVLMEPSGWESIETDALNSVWNVERLIWGSSLRRKIRNKRSRFYKYVPKLGVAGSAVMLVGDLWMRPALFLCAMSALMAIPFGKGTVAPRSIALIGLAFFIFALLRKRYASRMSKKTP